jgi:hypothetical protein
MKADTDYENLVVHAPRQRKKPHAMKNQLGKQLTEAFKNRLCFSLTSSDLEPWLQKNVVFDNDLRSQCGCFQGEVVGELRSPKKNKDKWCGTVHLDSDLFVQVFKIQDRLL